MADLQSMTFKLEQSLRDRLGGAANEHDVSQSELIRQGLEFWLAIIKLCPFLVRADMKRLTALARKVGKIIGILKSD